MPPTADQNQEFVWGPGDGVEPGGSQPRLNVCEREKENKKEMERERERDRETEKGNIQNNHSGMEEFRKFMFLQATLSKPGASDSHLSYSYSGGRDQEDHISRSAPSPLFMRPYLEKTHHKKGWSGSGSRVPA
jgi:hypothetical protein